MVYRTIQTLKRKTTFYFLFFPLLFLSFPSSTLFFSSPSSFYILPFLLYVNILSSHFLFCHLNFFLSSDYFLILLLPLHLFLIHFLLHLFSPSCILFLSLLLLHFPPHLPSPSSSITCSVLAYKTVCLGSHRCITKFLQFIHHLVCEAETTIQIPVPETDSLSETEYQTMDRVQKPINTRWSSTFANFMAHINTRSS